MGPLDFCFDGVQIQSRETFQLTRDAELLGLWAFKADKGQGQKRGRQRQSRAWSSLVYLARREGNNDSSLASNYGEKPLISECCMLFVA